MATSSAALCKPTLVHTTEPLVIVPRRGDRVVSLYSVRLVAVTNAPVVFDLCRGAWGANFAHIWRQTLKPAPDIVIDAGWTVLEDEDLVIRCDTADALVVSCSGSVRS